MMDKALNECKTLGLPEDLTERVRSWFLYTWEQQKTLGKFGLQSVVVSF
jgi:hypothetical protein